MDADYIKNLLRHYGLKPNITYGQNFLVDEIVLQDIVDAAEVTKEDQVLEIGPGIGNLTRLLCERAGFVLSLEKDPKFFPILHAIKKDFRENFRFEIVDALEYDFQATLKERGITADAEKNAEGTALVPRATRVLPRKVPRPSASYKVVANIPYYITGKILQMLMTAKFKPSSITILTQKEVAHNLVAQAGDLGLLAISVQLYGQPKLVQTVLAKSFYPAPKVDSAIIKIDLFDKPKYKIPDEKKFFKVLRACFAGKRKQIHNTLKNNLRLTPEQVQQILLETKISPSARPQELGIKDWIKLVEEVEKVRT